MNLLNFCAEISYVVLVGPKCCIPL